MGKQVLKVFAGIFLAVFLVAADAHGRHPRSRFDFYFGAPFGWGAPYYAPHYRYYEPPTIIIERQPPVYIQRSPGPVVQQPTWYYCPEPAGYYPYVQTCTVPWVPVDPKSVAPPPR